MAAEREMFDPQSRTNGQTARNRSTLTEATKNFIINLECLQHPEYMAMKGCAHNISTIIGYISCGELFSYIAYLWVGTHFEGPSPCDTSLWGVIKSLSLLPQPWIAQDSGYSQQPLKLLFLDFW